MTESPFKCCENKAKGIPDIWECRYFVSGSKRPDGYEHDHLKDKKAFFDRWDGPRDDDDVYFISDNTDVNVKLRKSGESEPTIKLRVLRTTRNEFQLWRTEFIERLPAPARAWKQVLEQLSIKVGGNEERLSSYSQASEVETALCAAAPKLLCREVKKHRWRYIGPLGEVEVAKVTVSSISPLSMSSESKSADTTTIRTTHLCSVSFESKCPDMTGIRTIRNKLGTGAMGVSESYVERLRRLQK